MGPTPAVAAMRRSGTPFALHEYAVDPSAPSYGWAAAEALGVDPDRVLKTLVCTTDADHVVAVIPVSGELDLRALARAVGAKRVEMAEPRVAQRLTGSVVGGISPLGHKRRLATVIDARALEFSTILVSGGRRGLEIELSPHDLAALTGARLAVVGHARGQ